MDLAKLAKVRYSLRKFSSRKVEEEKLALILEAARNAPTAKNYQPQRIFVADSPAALERADRCTECHFHPPLVLIVCYDPKTSWKQEKGPRQDYGAIDATIAATQMMLQAADIGVGSVMIGLFDPDAIAEEFPETRGLVPIAMLFFGYPAEGAKPSRLHEDRKPLGETAIRLK